MHSESSDQDPTDENKTYSFDGYFSKEPLRFLESNPQSKTYKKNTLSGFEDVKSAGLILNTFSVITKLPPDLFYS